MTDPQQKTFRAHAHPTAGYVAVAPFPDPNVNPEAEQIASLARQMGLQVLDSAARGIASGIVREVGPHLDGTPREEFDVDHVVFYPRTKAWDVDDGYHYVLAGAIICHRRPEED